MKAYRKKGAMGGSMGAIIGLVVGVGVAVLMLIFIGTLGGQTYNLVEPKILNISDSTIQTNVKDSIKSGFSALKQTGDYLPIIVLAYIIAIVLVLVLGFQALGGQGSGGAL